MNYSDFFNMLPELTLIAALLVVFFMDFFCPNTAERKAYLGTGTILMLYANACNIYLSWF